MSSFVYLKHAVFFFLTRFINFDLKFLNNLILVQRGQIQWLINLFTLFSLEVASMNVSKFWLHREEFVACV